MLERPLEAASIRLRGKPGRPRKQATQASAPPVALTDSSAYEAGMPATCPPRLLDVQAAADYLSVSVWTIRDLVTAGELPRIKLPLGRGDVRRLLFDRRDLDRLIDRSRGA